MCDYKNEKLSIFSNHILVSGLWLKAVFLKFGLKNFYYTPNVNF